MTRDALTERYRPLDWVDFLWQELALCYLINWACCGGRANLLLYGPPGCGKTSAVPIAVRDAFNSYKKVMTITQYFGTYTRDSWKDSYTVLNGRDLASTLNEKIDGILRSRYLQWIHIDEADGLTAGDQERLRKRMEGNSIATFILTCNERDKIQKAIVSRCRVIPFKPLPTQLVAQRLLYISIKEGFCDNPPTQQENNFLLKLAERSRGDLRVIDDLDLYVKDGKLDAEAMKDLES